MLFYFISDGRTRINSDQGLRMDPTFALAISAFFALFLLLTCELIRYRRLRHLAGKFHPSSIPFPIISFAILGKQCSVTRMFYSAEDRDIFKIRAIFSDVGSGIYLSYSWTLKCLLDWSRHTLNPSQLVVTDSSIANLILQDSDTWVKPKLGPPVDAIIGLSCTRARGQDAVRQRRILSNALRSPRVYEGYITEAARKLIEHLDSALIAKDGAGSACTIDVQPLIHQLSLDINITAVFGRKTYGISEFAMRLDAPPEIRARA
jgi:hypothetical protein